jgi:hypothetical protein
LGHYHAKTFLRGNCGGFAGVCEYRDNAGVCRRWKCCRWSNRRPRCRNHYRGGGRRAALLRATTAGLCGPRALLLLDARRAGMGWLSRRVDLSSHQSLRVRFTRPAPPAMLLAHFVGDALSRQAHELGEGRVRPARSTGQRGNEARHRSVAVTIGGSASRMR